jgi:hypothetical protein
MKRSLPSWVDDGNQQSSSSPCNQLIQLLQQNATLIDQQQGSLSMYCQNVYTRLNEMLQEATVVDYDEDEDNDIHSSPRATATRLNDSTDSINSPLKRVKVTHNASSSNTVPVSTTSTTSVFDYGPLTTVSQPCKFCGDCLPLRPFIQYSNDYHIIPADWVNFYERQILNDIITSKNLDIPQVFQIIGRQIDNKSFPIKIRNIDLESSQEECCNECAHQAFSAGLYYYRRSFSDNDIPSYATRRNDCWYGIECKSMGRDDHAKKLNHVGPNIRPRRQSNSNSSQNNQTQQTQSH